MSLMRAVGDNYWEMVIPPRVTVMSKYVPITSVSILLSLTLGLFCFARAGRIVGFYRNHYASHRLLKSRVMLPIRACWESDYAEDLIRICGILMLLMAAFLVDVMIRGLLL
jgi:hypothetical protein